MYTQISYHIGDLNTNVPSVDFIPESLIPLALTTQPSVDTKLLARASVMQAVPNAVQQIKKGSFILF